MVALVETEMRYAGFGVVSEAKCGDVGIVKAPLRDRRFGPVGAICVSAKQWAVFTPDRGVVIADMSVVRAWGLPANG